MPQLGATNSKILQLKTSLKVNSSIINSLLEFKKKKKQEKGVEQLEHLEMFISSVISHIITKLGMKLTTVIRIPNRRNINKLAPLVS